MDSLISRPLDLPLPLLDLFDLLSPHDARATRDNTMQITRITDAAIFNTFDLFISKLIS